MPVPRLCPLLATLSVAAFSVLLWSCGGGNKGQSEDDSVAESVRIIESRPTQFDAQTLEEMERALENGSVPGPEDIARMLVAAEAATGHLQAMLDELVRNDDPADTHGQLKELADRPWTRAVNTVIIYLVHAPSSESEHQRALSLGDAIGHARSTVIQLENDQLGGSSTGLAPLLTADTNQ